MTSYVVEFKGKDGEWHEELLYCNARSSQTIITNRLCAVPMTVLKAEPFSLELNDQVIARYKAVNVMGESEYSEASDVQATFALVQTVPFAPEGIPYEGPLTTTSQIHILLDEIPQDSTGGSPIISYQIDCDMNTNGQVWTTLKGYSVNDASLEFVQSGLQISVEY